MPRPSVGYRRRGYALLACAGTVLLMAAPALQAQSASRAATSDLRVEITAAIVLADLTVRPLALLQLKVVDKADSARVWNARAKLDGKAVLAIPRGHYRLLTPETVT